MRTVLDAWGSGPNRSNRTGGDFVRTIDHGRYLVDEVIGRGAFGITYAARDTRLRRPVAIKELFPPGCVRVGSQVVPTDAERAAEFAHLLDRFVDEAENLAQFNHPGIVRIYELIEESGTAYVVMERLTGSTLARLLSQRGGRLPVDDALRIIGEIGTALAAVHRSGLLHRDLKPDNVVITDDGRTVLVDFGAARQFRPDASSTMTQLVTPGYAPLEQYSTRSSFGPATDVYGLAATAYRMLAGQAPPAAIDRIHGVDLVPVVHVNWRVPPAVGDAIGRGLALHAGDRPQSVEAFLGQLRSRRTAVPKSDPGVSWLAGLQGLLDRARSRLPHMARPRRRPTPVRAWLPVMIGLAAIASVAPIHVAAAVAFIGLPAINAVRRTRAAYQRQQRIRGKRWHDPFGIPVALAAEAGHAIAAVATEMLEPLTITAAGVAVAIAGLSVLDDGRRPILAIRLIAAAAVVAFVVGLVRRLARNPRFPNGLAAELVAPLAADDGRLSSAGRVAWAAAVGLAVFVAVTPLWPLG